MTNIDGEQRRPSQNSHRITRIQLTESIGRCNQRIDDAACPSNRRMACTLNQVCNSETVLEEGERLQSQRWQEMSPYGNVLASPLHNKETKKKKRKKRLRSLSLFGFRFHAYRQSTDFLLRLARSFTRSTFYLFPMDLPISVTISFIKPFSRLSRFNLL